MNRFRFNGLVTATLILATSLSIMSLHAQDASATKGKPNAKKVPTHFQPPEVQAGLPHVLLIGDSISIGYMQATRKQLAGEANVWRPPTNCGPSTKGLESLEAWLGDRKWDVIHFNFGLHDLTGLWIGRNREPLGTRDGGVM